jgi:hypothetical protein
VQKEKRFPKQGKAYVVTLLPTSYKARKEDINQGSNWNGSITGLRNAARNPKSHAFPLLA